jgi:signal transduction histidine kinase
MLAGRSGQTISGKFIRYLLVALAVGAGVATVVIGASTRFDTNDPMAATILALHDLERRADWHGGRVSLSTWPALADRGDDTANAFWFLVKAPGNEIGHRVSPEIRREIARRVDGVRSGTWFFIDQRLGGAVGIRVYDGGIMAVGGAASPSGFDVAGFVAALVAEHVLPNIAIVLVVVAGVVAAMPRWLRRDIAAVSQRADALAAAQPGATLGHGDAPRDVYPLVDSFNTLLVAHERRIARQGRFLVDVAHELRQPLTLARMRVETMPKSPEMALVMADIDGLEAIISTMLAMARVRAEPLQVGIVDLALTARRLVADRHGMAQAVGQALAYDGPASGVDVLANPILLRSMIGNLVDNAIRHARSDDGTCVIVAVAGQRATLAVKDHGTGLGDGGLDPLLTAFARGTSAAPGTGIGLTLVEEATRLIGATLRSEVTPMRGTTIVIDFTLQKKIPDQCEPGLTKAPA